MHITQNNCEPVAAAQHRDGFNLNILVLWLQHIGTVEPDSVMTISHNLLLLQAHEIRAPSGMSVTITRCCQEHRAQCHQRVMQVRKNTRRATCCATKSSVLKHRKMQAIRVRSSAIAIAAEMGGAGRQSRRHTIHQIPNFVCAQGLAAPSARCGAAVKPFSRASVIPQARLRLGELAPAPGSHRDKQRKGRGHAAGQVSWGIKSAMHSVHAATAVELDGLLMQMGCNW
jgi:hypothetical protein